MLNFGLAIILLLIFVSGIIAYVGDYIGRSIGRKRLRLLKLRPRYTAIVFTVVTGGLIAVTTLAIILSFSQNARVALFGLEALKGDLAATQRELLAKGAEREAIEKELAAAKLELKAAETGKKNLERAKQKLAKEIEVSRQGKVLFNVNETLVTSLIQAGPEKKKLERGLRQLLSAADAYVRSLGVKREGHLIYLAPDEFEAAIAALQKSSIENIVVVIAAENVLFGEQVPVHLTIAENRRIYPAGAALAEISLPGGSSKSEIETEIKKLLYLAHQNAKKVGVIPDQSGSLGSISYADISVLSKKIALYKKPATIKAVAKNDVYPLGPLAVEFRVLYQ